MYKKSIILILVFSYFISQCQIKSGVVVYGAIPVENSSDKIYEGFGGNYKERIKQFDFKLIFNQQKSYFEINEHYKNNLSQETLIAKIKIGYDGEIFQNADSIYINLNPEDYYGEKLIIKEPVENKWVLFNETKMIDNLLCYKATTENIVISPNKTFHHPITAWYCPKIPVPFGPFIYGNLPGLILELQTRDGVFGAKSIKLNETEIVEKIPKIDKNARIISEDELNRLIREEFMNKDKQ